MVERRRQARIELCVPVKVYDIEADATHEGTLVNVSAGGLGITVPVELPIHAPIALEFHLPPKLVLRHVQAHVVRRHKVPGASSWLVGVAFYRLGRHLQSDLETFVTGRQREPLVHGGRG